MKKGYSQPRNRAADLPDMQDIVFALERASTSAPVIKAQPAPISIYETGPLKGQQKINPHVTRLFHSDSKVTDVFHVKPVYYLNISGGWRPMSEIASHYGNRVIVLKEDWADVCDLRYILWLLKRMELIGGKVVMPSPIGIVTRAKMLFTTTTFYPDANPETTTVDGFTKRQAAVGGEVWANIRGNAGTSAADSNTSDVFFQLNAYGGSPTGWYELVRSVYLFDTSPIASGSSISGATMSAYCTAQSDTSSLYALVAELALTAPSSNTALASSDFNLAKWTMTRQAVGIAQGSISTSAYFNLALNLTGLSNISKTGISKFGIVNSRDLDNSEPTMDGAHQTSYTASFADNTGTTQDPKLVVTYAAFASPVTSSSETGDGAIANDKNWYSGWAGWASVRDTNANVTNHSYSNDSNPSCVYAPGMRAGFSLGYAIGRVAMSFQYAIPSGVTITGAKVTVVSDDVEDNINDADSFVALVAYTGAATGYADADFANFGTTLWSPQYDITSLAAATPTDIVLNSTALATLVADGNPHVFSCGMREGHDINNTGGSISTAGGLNSCFNILQADNVTNRPVLTITYVTPKGGKGTIISQAVKRAAYW